MKKAIRVFLVTFLSLVCFSLFSPSQLLAEDIQGNQPSSSNNTNITFDLGKGENQEKQVVMSDGTIATVGITPADNQICPFANYNLGNGSGTWKVYWYTGVLNSEDWIDIKNYRIVWGYDYRSTAVGLNIYNQSLRYGNSWSTYRCDFNGVFSGSRILHGDISGHELVTSIVGF